MPTMTNENQNFVTGIQTLNGDAPNRSEIRREAIELSNRRNRIESEIREQMAILQAQGVDMNDSLVDNEGFPRNDLDIHLIRQTRQNIICLRNDLGNLQRSIEELVVDYFDRPNEQH